MAFKHILGQGQTEGYAYNMDIAKMQAEGGRVSTVVILLGGIASLNLSI